MSDEKRLIAVSQDEATLLREIAKAHRSYPCDRPLLASLADRYEDGITEEVVQTLGGWDVAAFPREGAAEAKLQAAFTSPTQPYIGEEAG